MPLCQVSHVEKNFRSIARQIPDLPVIESLTLRVVLILGRDLSARLDALIKPYGLSESEYRLLLALFSAGGSAHASELCAALAQSPANLTRIGDTLVQSGYAARHLDPADRRRIRLSLEPAGEELVRRLIPRISANVAAVFRQFDQAEKERLLDDMKKLLAGIDALSACEQQEHGKVA